MLSHRLRQLCLLSSRNQWDLARDHRARYSSRSVLPSLGPNRRLEGSRTLRRQPLPEASLRASEAAGLPQALHRTSRHSQSLLLVALLPALRLGRTLALALGLETEVKRSQMGKVAV